MHRLPLRYYHWQYVWIPLVAAGVWFGSLLAMLIVYLASGRPKYVSQEGNIAYISDVGASGLKPLFVTACAITAVGFFLSLVVERILRHTGRLVPDMRTREHVLSILAIIGSFIGGCGLLLLSILDTKRHSTAHRVCLLIFIVGIALSAIFSIIEYRLLQKDFPDYTTIRIAYIAKGLIATILILLAIAFGITLRVAQDVGAILEWIIAFGFTLYLLVFYYDLRLSKNVEGGQLRQLVHPSQSAEMTEIS
ncbi:Frag1/DRAM/Sfk1 [Gymnopilus junonius]|uniref:Frag1/DRAM/Sfk1 n=1 Tax=Gymnopilus junonius TaxID=109634 RepID=A0A9P5TNI3_GYMJU|nr:Frag1/DRAM/Sfk1 [Gymnopilus junonius]